MARPMGDKIKKSKNIIFKSHVYVEKGGRFHQGDIYYVQGKEREIPLQLNAVPFIDREEVIGREATLDELQQLLDRSAKKVLVSGLGGIGKTTLARYFVTHFRHRYHYLFWVQAGPALKEALINDTALIDSLCLRSELESLDKGERWVNQAFDLILNRLRQLKPAPEQRPNLLVLDNLEGEADAEQLVLTPHWKVLVTSRLDLEGLEKCDLGALAPEAALELFYRHYRRKPDDAPVGEIIQLVARHTLTVELLARTLQANRSLTPKQLLELLKREGLDISKAVAIRMTGYDKGAVNTYLFRCLEAAFDLATLSKEEQFILSQFSVLPAKEMPYEEIRELFGVKYDEKSGDERLIDQLNALSLKGWLAATAEGYRSHPVVMEVVRKKTKPDYITCLYLILNLTTKLKELNAGGTTEILKYLPYGTSILRHIEEHQQPLYLLANNVFEGYRQLGLVPAAYRFRLDYLEKARAIFEEDTTDQAILNFAIYLNNLAISSKQLFTLDNKPQLLEDALAYQEEAITWFERIQSPAREDRLNIANAYDVWCALLLEHNDLEAAIEIAKRSMSYKEEHLPEEDILQAVSLNNFAHIYLRLGDHDHAGSYFFNAIKLVEDSPGKNHRMLATLYTNLSQVYLALDRLEPAEYAQIQAILQYREGDYMESVEWAQYLENVAVISIRQSKFETAREYCKRAHESYVRQLGPRHQFSLRTQQVLAFIQQKLESPGPQEEE